MNIRVTEPALSSPAVSATSRPLVRIVIVGHVDHGKSTLIGRLLHETGSLPEGKLGHLKAVSDRRGMTFEWSFLLDALQTERDQGITIDTSQIRFRTPSRDVVLIDAPGHAEFLRNMITGAAQADAALLIVDAVEGVRDQTRRHGYLLHLLGVRQVAVVINKMDRVDFDAARFRELEAEIAAHLSGLGLTPMAAIPISAREGEGVARRTSATAWYDGPTVLEALDGFSPSKPAATLPLRLPVQAVYKFDDRRIIAGRIDAGGLCVGDALTVMPQGTTARVKSIESWPAREPSAAPRQATAGQSVGITLDRPIFVARGSVMSAAASPAQATRHLRARVFWLHTEPLGLGSRLVVRIGTAEAHGEIVAIDHAVDPGRLADSGASAIAQNHVGEVEIALSSPIACDTYADHPGTGRIVLEFAGRIAGGGLVLTIGKAEVAQAPAAPDGALAARAARLNDVLRDLSPPERLERLRREVKGRIVFTTSFGLEDQAITHWLRERGLDVDLVTLDTGRLFEETYAVWAETERRYGRRIRAVYPDHLALEALVARQGINGLYESQEARFACCHVRKVEPLNRALGGAEAWITGLRGDQSAYRHDMAVVTADIERGLVKLSPLFDWSRDDVLNFAKGNGVPISPLHARGFASIGCAPCTRAIAPGEPERAGRWWWEDEDKKECGLHARRS
jgi:sulfate adenylyltransferase large subunit/phosphoadenylyl-sulfate reductase (thioredoxin)